MKIEDFLQRHTIVKIGMTPPEYVCCEVVLDDPRAFARIVRENRCYVTEVRWWDCAEIALESPIGYGGPRDSRSPDKYFFAETDIGRVFPAGLQDEEYDRYFDKIKQAYARFDLYPAFDVRRL